MFRYNYVTFQCDEQIIRSFEHTAQNWELPHRSPVTRVTHRDITGRKREGLRG